MRDSRLFLRQDADLEQRELLLDFLLLEFLRVLSFIVRLLFCSVRGVPILHRIFRSFRVAGISKLLESVLFTVTVLTILVLPLGVAQLIENFDLTEVC